MLHTSEGKLDAASRPVIVDVNLTCYDPLSQSHLSRPVARPHAGGQPVVGAVRDLDGVVLVLEGESGQNRTEDLLLCDRMIDRRISKKRRRIEEATVGRIRDHTAPRDNSYPVAARLIDERV